MSRLATLQGVDTKRRLVRLLLARVAVYTFAFAVAVAASRVLVGDQLSDVIADMTSTWVEVPDESVELYRLLGYQEGSLSNGHVTFRDLSDYHAVVDIIKGQNNNGFPIFRVLLHILWNLANKHAVENHAH